MTHRRAILICLCFLFFSAHVVVAEEIELNTVTYPERKTIKLEFSPTQRAPRAKVEAKVKFEEGQAWVEVEFDSMKPAVLFGGDVTCYVVWAVSRDGTLENLGELWMPESKGQAEFATGRKAFALMITAEPIVTVRTPGDLVVFFSGTPRAKDVKPTAFTFGGLSTRNGMVERDRESIAGMSYKTDKKNPLALMQADQ